MEQSILKSTKKILGINPDDSSFDLDIITHINAAFSDLQQLGVGPVEGFAIEDEVEEWLDFLTGDLANLNRAKSFVYLKTRMLFDPPATQYLVASMEKQLEQMTWRLNVQREESEWVDPNPPVVIDEG